MKNLKTIRFIFLLFLSIFSFEKINAQCNLNCNATLELFGTPGEILTITIDDILSNPNTGCDFLTISSDTLIPPILPTTIPSFQNQIFLTASSTPFDVAVIITGIDSMGNVNSNCWGTITVNPTTGSSCLLNCNQNNNFSVPPAESLVIYPNDILSNTPNCDVGISMVSGGTYMDSIVVDPDTYGTFPISVAELDSQGNILSVCWSNITINPDCFLYCVNTVFTAAPGESLTIFPDYVTSTNSNCYDLSIMFDNSGVFADSVIIPADTYGTFPFSVGQFDAQGSAVNSCWGNITIEDPLACTLNCNDQVHISLIVGDELVINPDMILEGAFQQCGNLGMMFDSNQPTGPFSLDSLIVPAGTYGDFPVTIAQLDAQGNVLSSCWTTVSIQPVQLIQGTIFIDGDMNCIFDPSIENSVGGLKIQYSLDQGISFSSAVVDTDGNYSIYILGQPGTSMEADLQLILPDGITSNCPTSESFTILFDSPITKNFSVELADSCDNMTVDVSTNVLRSCVPIHYDVNYCNLSTYDIDDAELRVTFPADYGILGAQLPFTNLGNNELLFDLGTVPSGTCEKLEIEVIVDCSVPLGATKCVEASITPNSCLDSLNSWNGSTLRVTGACDGTNDLVRFKIENIGTGDMINPINYIVVEDVIMSMTQPVQLPSGGMETVEIPANGSTWRLEIPQEPGHPYLSIPSAAIEGCVNYGSMGFITQFSTPDVESFVSIDCQEVVSSYDPNDKQAYPTGYSTENFIEPNTSLEYKIRFQNTGNDTAFYVRLEDRISEHLDITSIEPGASSHPYRFELKDDGIINFHFENILLPDSTTNLEESQGYVQFRIHQLPNNTIGTVIENTADIYFDFNEAVVTNTVHHTIGENFISTGTVQTFIPNLKIGVAPNPFTDFTNITLEGIEHMDGEFELYDMMGRLVKADNFSDNLYRLERAGLSSGTYLFRFKNEKGLLANGKLVIQ